MKTIQVLLRDADSLQGHVAELASIRPTLILVFASPSFFIHESFAKRLLHTFPDTLVLGCSTAGEIAGTVAHENTCVLTGVHFEHAQLSSASTQLAGMSDSRDAGRRLAAQISGTGLRGILVFGPGVDINGSAMIEGMTEALADKTIPITGGLAGDGGQFKRTWTIGPHGVSDRAIVAVGLAGEGLRIGHGSFGGWQPFGPVRKVTRCDGNVLHELDGEPALEIYKRYLGEYAKDLPSSGLLFPFSMIGDDKSATGLIRTILGIDEQTGSLTLAGDIHANGYLQLMHALTDSLVDGAEAAAVAVKKMSTEASTSLAVLVSCVGRRLVMGSRVDEEVEAVAGVLGKAATLTGFYSYGEISPHAPGVECKLHNQTMTITTFAED